MMNDNTNGAARKRLGRSQFHHDTLTTGEVASLLDVSTKTASGWIDAGLLKGYRIPGGSQDRRVTRKALVAFCGEHGIPVPAALSAGLLLCGLPLGLPTVLRQALPRVTIDLAASLIGAAFVLGESGGTLLAGAAAGRTAALELGRATAGAAVRLIWLAGEDEVRPDELALAGWEVVPSDTGEGRLVALVLGGREEQPQ